MPQVRLYRAVARAPCVTIADPRRRLNAGLPPGAAVIAYAGVHLDTGTRFGSIPVHLSGSIPSPTPKKARSNHVPQQHGQSRHKEVGPLVSVDVSGDDLREPVRWRRLPRAGLEGAISEVSKHEHLDLVAVPEDQKRVRAPVPIDVPEREPALRLAHLDADGISEPASTQASEKGHVRLVHVRDEDIAEPIPVEIPRGNAPQVQEGPDLDRPSITERAVPPPQEHHHLARAVRLGRPGGIDVVVPDAFRLAGFQDVGGLLFAKSEGETVQPVARVAQEIGEVGGDGGRQDIGCQRAPRRRA